MILSSFFSSTLPLFSLLASGDKGSKDKKKGSGGSSGSANLASGDDFGIDLAACKKDLGGIAEHCKVRHSLAMTCTSRFSPLSSRAV